ncbi:hypothetical protein CDL15_Pgr014300 [Punica granatum]|nr:hypothetical protein CDL15_Pgr014300 [Punica granatum]
MDNSASSCPTTLSESQQLRLLDKLEVFEIRGHDKHGRKVLRVIGKLFPARFVSAQVLQMYLEERIYPKLGERPFAVVYVHTGVQRTENCPGISIIRSVYEAIPIDVKQNLEVIYFVHPGIQARLFLATFGRLLFSGG